MCYKIMYIPSLVVTTFYSRRAICLENEICCLAPPFYVYLFLADTANGKMVFYGLTHCIISHLRYF